MRPFFLYKYNFLLLFLSFFFIINISSAQVEEPMPAEDIEVPDLDSQVSYPGIKNILKLEFSSIFWGNIPLSSEYGLTYERLLGKRHSVQIRAAYIGFNLPLTLDKLQDTTFAEATALTMRGFHISGNYRYYLKKNSPNGAYFGPYFSYVKAEFFEKQDPVKNRIDPVKYSFGGIIGYQRTMSRLVLDAYIGLGYRYRNWSYEMEESQTNSGTNSVSYSKFWTVVRKPAQGIAIPISLSVGYAF